MSLCQLLSILELYHIADGIEKARLLPRFIQVCTAARPLAEQKWISNEYLVKQTLCVSGGREEPPADPGHPARGDAK